MKNESKSLLSASSGEALASIDVGSNSVRLLILDGGNEKYVETTRLSEGLSKSGELSVSAMLRTVEAVKNFAAIAKERRCGVFVFATEAVRKATNRNEFLQLVKDSCGLCVDVLSGEEEALSGFLGVNEKDDFISVLDIGGASTELATGKGTLENFLSVPIGAVRLKENCGRDREKLDLFILEKIKDYDNVTRSEKLFGIGGTISTIASTLLELEEYDRAKVHGYEIKKPELDRICDKLFASSVDEIKTFVGMDPRRADVICGGAELLKLFMERFGYSSIIVSETDNLEGYLKLRGRRGGSA